MQVTSVHAHRPVLPQAVAILEGLALNLERAAAVTRGAMPPADAGETRRPLGEEG